MHADFVVVDNDCKVSQKRSVPYQHYRSEESKIFDLTIEGWKARSEVAPTDCKVLQKISVQ